MFSPYYAWARRGGAADPLNHCALNVALYGGGARWAMTERGRRAVRRSAKSLAIGPSSLSWDGDALVVQIDEMAVPVPRRIRGTVRLHPSALTGRHFALDQAGRHHWAPLAPIARVEVAMEQPNLRWSGGGYLDMNAGAAPLEQDFARWDWSCARTAEGAAVLYDVTPRQGAGPCLGLRFDRGGAVTPFVPPPRVALPPTLWRVPRGIRAEDGAVQVMRSFEDAPFYSRAEVVSRLFGERVAAMHETVSLDRFRAGIVQAMLPFRMPCRRG